jgi:trehalose 6-phosphate phosphatase
MPAPPLPNETSALFLDLDGTLLEIAPRPDAVAVPPGLAVTLASVERALEGAVAILSGRSIATIDALLQPPLRCVAGVHGAERRNAAGRLSRVALPDFSAVAAAADALVERHPGLLVERKPGAIALHYRGAPEFGPRCIDVLGAAVEARPDIELLLGKMVVEAKPRSVHKGTALSAFLAEPPFAGRRPWHLGDDRTDEHAFAVVNRLGGVAVKVGEGPSVAPFRLADAAAVRDWLARVGAGWHTPQPTPEHQR